MDPSEPVIDFPGFTTLQSQVYQNKLPIVRLLVL
jgi:hypothetical protein